VNERASQRRTFLVVFGKIIALYSSMQSIHARLRYCRPLFDVLLVVLLSATYVHAAPGAPSDQPVQVQMKNVALHVDEDTVVNVSRLRGELIGTRSGAPPFFDDKDSFIVRIDSAEIAITAAGLSRLMNEHVLKDAGASLRAVEIGIEGGRLTIKGKVGKGVSVPFTMVATPSVDRGNLRLHPTSLKALGIPVKKLLSLFRVELDELVKVNRDRGMRLDGDDFVLEPSRLLPSPKIEGKLQAVRVEQDRIVQVFGPGRLPPLHPPDPSANYMYYRGGTLRFSKLTMIDADMELIDLNRTDPFDFFQEKYVAQLVAGYSKNTPARGLKVYMPDYHRVKPAGP
jgi:hypothetical protein